jgi:hypothetical protein
MERRTSSFYLAAASVAVAWTAGCEAIGAQRTPLTAIEDHQPQDAGAQGPAHGTSAPSAPVGSAACWTARLPPEPQPPAPQLTVDEACRRGTTSTS